MQVLEASAGPIITARFSPTVEQKMLKDIEIEFDRADSNFNGFLDRDDLVSAMKALYRKGGISRTKNTVQLEVDNAMAQWDTDAVGHVNFDEFLVLILSSPEFKLPLNTEEKKTMIDLADRNKVTSSLRGDYSSKEDHMSGSHESIVSAFSILQGTYLRECYQS